MRRTRADDTLSGRSTDRGRDLEIFRWGTTISPTTFIDLLADLPDGVTDMANARATAGEMADTLKAAMITDRLFVGTGEPVDPALLLTRHPAPLLACR